MESNLRPLTLGEILDRTAQLYRTNFLLFAGIFSVYAGVVLVLNLLQIGLGELLKSLHMPGALIWMTLITAGVELLLIFLLFGAALAAISRAVAWVHLGEPATIRGAYLSILPRLGRYLWLMTITAFFVWTPFVALYAGYFGTMAAFGLKNIGTHSGGAAHPPDPQAVMIVGMATLAFVLLLIPVAVYTTLMGLRYSLAIPACVVENMKARKAIRRSIELSKGSWGRIFLLGLLVGVIKIGLVLLTQLFVFIAVFKQHGQVGPGLNAISQVISFFTTAFLGPIYATGITLFYYDQRVRKEGYDIEWMMQAAGLMPPEPVAELAAPGAPVSASAEPAPAPQDPGSVHE
jgi:hypothetical protein